MSRAPKLGFVSGFDGIRGIGIMMVLYEHALSDSKFGVFSFAPIVDVFLVLSAFLIVTLLLQEHRSTGSIDLRKFYQRRATRLFPTLWLYLLTMLVLSAVFLRHLFTEVLKDAAAAFFYVYNLVYPPTTAAFHPTISQHRAMSPLWTLSLEEQFYMVIAGTVLLCIVKRWIKPLVVVSVLGAIAIQYFRAVHMWGPFQIVMQRPDALLLGVALAGVNAQVGELGDRGRRVLRWVASVALVVGILTMFSSSNLVQALGGPWVKPIPTHYASFVNDAGERITSPYPYDPRALYFVEYGHTVVIWAALAVVLGLYRTPEWRAARFMSMRPFRYVGRLSYTLYVWHSLAIVLAVALLGEAHSSTGSLVRAVVVWIFAFALAIPIYNHVELRFQKKKLTFSSEKVVVDVATGKEVEVSGGKVSDIPAAPAADPAVPPVPANGSTIDRTAPPDPGVSSTASAPGAGPGSSPR